MLRTLTAFILFACSAITGMATIAAPASASEPTPRHTVGAYYASGVVTDSVSGEPVPFASISVVGKAGGVLTNDDGDFRLTIPDGATAMQVACLGYEKKTVALLPGSHHIYDIRLAPIAMDLQEVVVRKQKYSKKNNPAVDFVRSLKEKAPLTDPRRNDFYSYDKHQLITFALNDYKSENKHLDFLDQHVDTSEISGKPILNIIVKERVSNVQYRKNPQAEKEIIEGLRESGIDEMAEQSGVTAFMEDFLQEVDLYQNDISLLRNRFVSPLSRIAPDFYKFYLTDTVDVGDERCIVLSFYPHNPATFGFNGQVFVSLADSNMFIKKVTLRNPRQINLNFIDEIYLTQEYERAADGSRLKTRDDLVIEAQVMPGTPKLYVRRNLAFANHSFQQPVDQSAFGMLGSEIVMPEAYLRDAEFWDNKRLLHVTDNEKRIDQMMASLRQVPFLYWAEKVLKIAFTGYISTGNPSKFDLGPVNTVISGNSLEGLRLRVGGMTTANLNKHLFAKGYVAYGTKDKKFKYSAELEYSFNEKQYHGNEFPIHSIKVSSLYDIDQIGQHYLFTNPDNFVLVLKRMPDKLITYHHVNQLSYTLELANHFSVKTTLKNDVQEASRFVPFYDGYGNNFRHFTTNSLELQLRYAPGEKFYQTRSHRFPISHDNMVFMITQKFGPKGFLGSNYWVNATELSFTKRFWFSAFGYIDTMAKGGHVWSRSPYTSLMIPNANLSYTIQPEAYMLMNPMEFVNDSYAAWEMTYFMNGLIFNYMPLIKKLKIREVVSFRGLWGHLSEKNDPVLNPQMLQFPAIANVTRMSNTPYMELSAGLDNLFGCIRLDYVWRLSYTAVPYPIDRRGLRVAVHASF